MVLMFLITSCIALQPRPEIEAELLNVITAMAPIAKELKECQDNTGVAGALKRTRQVLDKTYVAPTRQEYNDIQRKSINLESELSPYKFQIYQLKYKFINRFGVIEYNNFIKSHYYAWGLGIYW